MKPTTLLPLLGLFLVPGTPGFAQNATPKPVAAPASASGVAADVNGEKIMVADLNRIVETIKAQEPSFATNTPAAQKALIEVRQQVLDDLITTRVLAQEARKRGIAAKVEDVNKSIAQIRSSFKTEAEFKAALAEDGKTPDDLRKIIAEELAIRELSTQLTRDVTVSGEDIAQYYRANPTKFTIPEGIKAHHILLAINAGAPQSEKERVRKRAQELIRQLQNGANFDTLAKTNSDDPGSKDTGGNLGAFTRGQMVKPFEDAAFAAQPGKVVGPVETEFGFHIIRVDEKIASKMVPLAEVQANPEMKAFLLKRKVQARLEETIAQLKQKGKITKYA